MKIVCISDTHNEHENIRGGYGVPDGDVLVHAGDATLRGTMQEFASFTHWMSKQPHEYKLYVPGNHDHTVQKDLRTCYTMCRERGIFLLIDDPALIKDVLFYGSPWVPNLRGWAFYADARRLEERFSKIPDKTGVLVTHAPPSGTLDLIPGALVGQDCHGQEQDEWTDEHGLHVGSIALLRRVTQLDHLRLHVFGHIHEGYGSEEYVPRIDEYKMAYQSVNASICTRAYMPTNEPIVVDI